MSAALHLTEQLIAQASVTPADGQYQRIIAQRLTAAGCACRSLPLLEMLELHPREQP